MDKPDSKVQPHVAILTRQTAEKLWPGENPIGKQYYSWGDEPTRVIGIIEHMVRPNNNGGFGEFEYAQLLPVRVPYTVGGNFLMRIDDPAQRQATLDAAEKVLLKNANNRLIVEQKTMEEMRHEFYRGDRAMACQR